MHVVTRDIPSVDCIQMPGETASHGLSEEWTKGSSFLRLIIVIAAALRQIKVSH